MKQRIINTICALALIAGGLLVVADGIVALFGCEQFWQYSWNFIYFAALLPLCIGASDWPRRLHPELFGKEVGQ